MISVNGQHYTKLNVACGNTPHTKFPLPWFNVDIKGEVADFICDVRKLPPKWLGKFNEVRASHVLEHFFMEDHKTVLNEWVRVLEPGGIFRLAVPDLTIVINCLTQGHDKKMRPAISGVDPTPVMAQIYGIGYETVKTEDRLRHRMIFDKESLIELIKNQGQLEDIHSYPQLEDPACKLGIRDDSQNQFTMCILAVKKQ